MKTLTTSALLATLAIAQGSALAESAATEYFVIRCSPGSRAEASLDRVASSVEADLAAILKELVHVVAEQFAERGPEPRNVLRSA